MTHRQGGCFRCIKRGVAAEIPQSLTNIICGKPLQVQNIMYDIIRSVIRGIIRSVIRGAIRGVIR